MFIESNLFVELWMLNIYKQIFIFFLFSHGNILHNIIFVLL